MQTVRPETESGNLEPDDTRAAARPGLSSYDSMRRTYAGDPEALAELDRFPIELRGIDAIVELLEVPGWDHAPDVIAEALADVGEKLWTLDWSGDAERFDGERAELRRAVGKLLVRRGEIHDGDELLEALVADELPALRRVVAIESFAWALPSDGGDDEERSR